MKRIGLMTCFIDNYGACLQAYALQKTIQSFGHSCEIIDWNPQSEWAASVGHAGNPAPMITRILRTLVHPFKFIARRQHMRLSNKRAEIFAEFKRDYLVFSKEKYLYSKELIKLPRFDACVTGSDQLWNPLIHNNINVKPYFLDFCPEGTTRVAYAPSIGVFEIPDDLREEMTRLLSDVDYLSVRETEGAALVTQLTGRDCRVVIDPTLLLSSGEWEQILRVIPEAMPPYILCYAFGYDKRLQEFLDQLKRETQYNVFTLPFSFDNISNAKELYEVGPRGFAYLIRNAACIVTDSFHATAFSINFNKPFYTFLRCKASEANNMNSRIFSILEIFGLTDRLVTPDSDFNEKIKNMSIDYTPVNDELERRRAADRQYLKEAIDGKR